VDLLEPSLLQLALLCAAALVAGVIDAIAGGGGLLTLPALLAAGLPPHQALGTNKGQSVFGSSAALLRFARGGLVDRKIAQVTFPFGLAGALCGAWLVTFLQPSVLRPLVLVLLIAVAAFLAFRPPVKAPGAVPRHLLTIASLIALTIGAYDGFFGPGTGTFLIVAFVGLLGIPLARATADAKVVNFASNLASVALFASRGLVLWKIALPMAAFQFLGGTLGAHLAIKGGDRLVRRVVLGVVAALVLKLGWDLYVDR
jgi:uncharacterized membrane protein YfcA